MIELATATTTSSARPHAFYSRWIDHSTWQQWSPDAEWVRLDGPVAGGTTGTLKPTGGPQVRFTITTLTPDQEYTDTSTLLGARLVFQHLAHVDDDRTVLAVRVTVDGPLSWLWARILGQSFAASAPTDLARLVELVETAQAKRAA
jgi:hypothetical protein